MTSAVSSISSISAADALRPSQFSDEAVQRTPDPRELEVREKFQDFTAGTFFKTMLKALRSSQQKPAYFHGGQAEEIFQSHLDGELSEHFAKDFGAPISEPLFNAYRSGRRF